LVVTATEDYLPGELQTEDYLSGELQTEDYLPGAVRGAVCGCGL
jgi:hypothetical protein